MVKRILALSLLMVGLMGLSGCGDGGDAGPAALDEPEILLPWWCPAGCTVV